MGQLPDSTVKLCLGWPRASSLTFWGAAHLLDWSYWQGGREACRLLFPFPLVSMSLSVIGLFYMHPKGTFPDALRQVPWGLSWGPFLGRRFFNPHQDFCLLGVEERKGEKIWPPFIKPAWLQACGTFPSPLLKGVKGTNLLWS